MSADDVFITGLGLCTPFGSDTLAFVEGLRESRCCAAPIVRFDTADLASGLACCVPEEATEGLSPKHRRLPRAYRYAMVAANEALSDSALIRDGESHDRIGVFFGSPSNTELAETFDATLLGEGPRLVSPLAFENITCMAGPGTLSIDRGITGPTMALPGGLVAGLQALHLARTFVRSGRLDAALVVACDEVSPLYYRSLTYLRLLSPRRRGDPELSRPFDPDRNGMVLGEGAAALVLERESHARPRGARMYARVAASAVTHDGACAGAGLEGSLRSVVNGMNAGQPAVDYVAACANSTQALDEAEAAALACVFPADRPAVSSIKAMTGETGAASGLLNVAACVCAIEESFVPATLNTTGPPEGSGLDLVTGSARAQRIDVAVADAYSFGGVSASVLLQRPLRPPT